MRCVFMHLHLFTLNVRSIFTYCCNLDFKRDAGRGGWYLHAKLRKCRLLHPGQRIDWGLWVSQTFGKIVANCSPMPYYASSAAATQYNMWTILSQKIHETVDFSDNFWWLNLGEDFPKCIIIAVISAIKQMASTMMVAWPWHIKYLVPKQGVF